MKIICKYVFLMLCGGIIYILCELIWRGYSHWTMFILGGVCFAVIGCFNELQNRSTPLLLQMLYGSILITELEFIVGCTVNLHLGWNVWHYTEYDILGQISLKSSLLWFLLSAAAILLDDQIRYRYFGGKRPSYKLL